MIDSRLWQTRRL